MSGTCTHFDDKKRKKADVCVCRQSKCDKSNRVSLMGAIERDDEGATPRTQSVCGSLHILFDPFLAVVVVLSALVHFWFVHSTYTTPRVIDALHPPPEHPHTYTHIPLRLPHGTARATHKPSSIPTPSYCLLTRRLSVLAPPIHHCCANKPKTTHKKGTTTTVHHTLTRATLTHPAACCTCCRRHPSLPQQQGLLLLLRRRRRRRRLRLLALLLGAMEQQLNRQHYIINEGGGRSRRASAFCLLPACLLRWGERARGYYMCSCSLRRRL
jgi:hypothetical protein